MTLSFYSVFLHLVFFSLPLVAIFKGKGTVILVVLLGALHLKDFWMNRVSFQDRVLRHLKTPLGKSALAFILWAFLSSIWSEFPLKSFANAGRYGLLALIGYGLYGTITHLSLEKKTAFFKAFFRGYAFYLAFFFMEIYGFPLGSFFYTDVSWFNSQLFIKGIVNLGFLFWPFLFFASQNYPKEKFPKVLFFLTALAMLIFLKAAPDAARVGILLGFFGAILTYYKPKAPYVFSILLIALSLGMPWIFKSYVTSDTLGQTFHYLPTSYQHRLLIWHEMSKKTLEKPMIGHGFDYATTLSQGPMMCLKRGDIKWHINPQKIEILPPVETGCSYIFTSHPHNGIVQVWVELGFVGVLLLMGILWFLTLTIVKIQNPRERATLFGLLLFYEMIMLVSSGLWQKWIGATLILALLAFRAGKDAPKISP